MKIRYGVDVDKNLPRKMLGRILNAPRGLSYNSLQNPVNQHLISLNLNTGRGIKVYQINNQRSKVMSPRS